MTPEGKVKAKVNALLKRHGIWYFYPFSFGAGIGGIPDIIAIIRGRFAAIEVKSGPKVELTALQRRRAIEITKAGGIWLRVHDDETLRLLEAVIQGE